MQPHSGQLGNSYGAQHQPSACRWTARVVPAHTHDLLKHPPPQVPVDVTTVPCMYVFVDITIDVDHLVDTIRLNFP